MILNRQHMCSSIIAKWRKKVSAAKSSVLYVVRFQKSVHFSGNASGIFWILYSAHDCKLSYQINLCNIKEILRRRKTPRLVIIFTRSNLLRLIDVITRQKRPFQSFNSKSNTQNKILIIPHLVKYYFKIFKGNEIHKNAYYEN